LLWQTFVPGSLFTVLDGIQKSMAREQLAQANLSGAVVVLGYWRSGTTLLHELLCLDNKYSFPTTHACMNSHHFLLTEESALRGNQQGVRRPMDEMEVRPGSPQEDEFALLSMGARSPYEALLIPSRLASALKLADPRDLPAPDAERWKSVFISFLRAVSIRGAGRPLILKSPTHGFRVATLRELLPDARFVLIVRDPMTNFESTVRMWRRMMETYGAFGPILTEDEIREIVLADRLRFEEKLAAGTMGIPDSRFAILPYESLVADPVGEIERLYTRLDLGDFAVMRAAYAFEASRRSAHRAQGQLPSEHWRERLAAEWSAVFTRYGYPRP
jgi:hypothetical protein